MNTVTGYKTKSGSITVDRTAFPDALNALYAHLEQKANKAMISFPPDTSIPVPVVTVAEVRSPFLRVNPRSTTGPARVLGHVLRNWALQLVGVFTDIFNLSLLHSEAPYLLQENHYHTSANIS